MTAKQRQEEKFKIGNGKSQQREATFQHGGLQSQLGTNKEVFRWS